MNAMKYKGYAARVEFDADDRIFVGHLAGIRDIVGFHGSSVEELENAFHEAVDDYLAALEWVVEEGCVIVLPVHNDFLRFQGSVKTGSGDIAADIAFARASRPSTKSSEPR